MTRTFLLAATAAVLSLATPALANDQLARSLGVEPGAYTTAELAQLRTAVQQNDEQRIRLITERDVVSTQSGVSAGQTQFAGSLGVEPGAYTTAELAILRTAIEENDEQRIQLITDRDVVSTQSGVSAGQTQLARSLGVEPGAYTTAELARLRTAVQENDEQRIQLITGAE